MTTAAGRTLHAGALLPELIAVRGIAAVAIVCAHALSMAARGHGGVPPSVEYARLIVDFFFIQSGFVLAHVYDRPWREGRFHYLTFLGKRLARLWPLHVVTLLAVAALVLAGRAAGLETENPHTLWSFAVTFLMLHSTWATSDLAWNWPSWSVSAEWCAYLAIPLFFLAADRVRGSAARISVGLGLFVACAAFSELVLGADIVTLTYDGGAFRIIPSFFAGMLLRRMFDVEPALVAMSPRGYAATVGGVLAACAALIAMNATYDALWPLMVVLTAALASRAAQPKPGLLRGRALAWLGELSYAIYMTHAIVLQVTFTGAKLLGIGHTFPQRAALGFAALIATAVVAQAAYTLVEKPGRGLMARLLSQPRPARAFAAAADRTGAGR